MIHLVFFPPSHKRVRWMEVKFYDYNISFYSLQGSYAEEAFDLRIANGPYIPKGFAIKGRVNTFGWSIYAHVKLSDSVNSTFSCSLFQRNNKSYITKQLLSSLHGNVAKVHQTS